MNPTAVTLKNIAENLNFSVVTISKALRDHNDISLPTSKLIHTTTHKIGPAPDIPERNLSDKKNYTIGIVIPKVAHSFFGSIIENIYEIASANNFEIILMTSQENAEREKQHIQTLLAMKVDGIIISITQETKDYQIFQKITEHGTPIVFIDRIPNLEEINSVAVDDYGGSFKAVEHIIKLGYTKIGHISGFTNINIGRSRKKGFLDALQKHNIPLNPAWLMEGGFGENSGYDFFMKLYEKNNLPEVIFTVTYPVALGIYKAAKEVGIKIPQDIDVICFGNAGMHTLLSPALSCIDQPTDEIAVQSMDLLLSILKNPGKNKTEQRLIDTNLVLRETCVSKNFPINVNDNPGRVA